jgi:hypothetical protein
MSNAPDIRMSRHGEREVDDAIARQGRAAGVRTGNAMNLPPLMSVSVVSRRASDIDIPGFSVSTGCPALHAAARPQRPALDPCDRRGRWRSACLTNVSPGVKRNWLAGSIAGGAPLCGASSCGSTHDASRSDAPPATAPATVRRCGLVRWRQPHCLIHEANPLIGNGTRLATGVSQVSRPARKETASLDPSLSDSRIVKEPLSARVALSYSHIVAARVVSPTLQRGGGGRRPEGEPTWSK